MQITMVFFLRQRQVKIRGSGTCGPLVSEGVKRMGHGEVAWCPCRPSCEPTF